MAKDFVARGVPLNGIGLQMHVTNANADLSGIEPNIQRLTALGLQVQYTELDVRLPVDSSGNASAADLATQAQIYQSAVAICLMYPLCTAVQTWGFTDKHSWIPGSFPGFGAALEFDANYQPKPAYTAMQSALQNSPPVITAGAITNAASYANAAVAPGEIVVLFGATYGPASLQIAQLDSSLTLPTNLSGARLYFDGVPAPLLYARTDQISAIVPFSVSGKTTTQVQYEYQNLRSNTVAWNVVPTVPSLFTLDNSGSGPGAILDRNYKVVSSSNPAHHGDVIQLYATGGGVTTPASVDGRVSMAGPLGTISGVTMKIGGVDCTVQYAGGASGLVAGGIQVNVLIAEGVPTGDEPILLTIAGASSPATATVAIR